MRVDHDDVPPAYGGYDPRRCWLAENSTRPRSLRRLFVCSSLLERLNQMYHCVSVRMIAPIVFTDQRSLGCSQVYRIHPFPRPMSRMSMMVSSMHCLNECWRVGDGLWSPIPILVPHGA